MSRTAIFLCLVLPVVGALGLAGGRTQIQPPALNDTKIVFAINAINDMFKSKNDLQTRTGVRVISATSQVVQGAMYRYEIEITGGGTNEICEVAVWHRSWLPQPEKMKISGNIQCKKIIPEPPAIEPVPGGLKKVASNDAAAQKAFKFLISDINNKMNSLNQVKGVSTGQILTQVVNGINYFFTNFKLQLVTGSKPVSVCNATVYWNPRASPEYKVSGLFCHQQSPSPAEPAPGGLTKIASNDAGVQKAFKFLFKHINAKISSSHKVQGTSTGRVFKQIVNGINYYFVNLKLKLASGTGPVSLCNATVYWNPRASPKYKVNAFHCRKISPAPAAAEPVSGGLTKIAPEDADLQKSFKFLIKDINQKMSGLNRAKGLSTGEVFKQQQSLARPDVLDPLPGGLTKVASNDADLKKAFTFLIKDINDKMSSLNKVQGSSTGEVFKQIVNGVNYLFVNFKLKLTTGSAPVSVCNATVYWNPRASPEYKVSGFTCRSPKASPIDPIPGGETVVKLSDPDVQKALQVITKRVNLGSNSFTYLNATNASKVTKQIVNGVIYKFYSINYFFTSCSKSEVSTTPNKVCSISNPNGAPETVCTSTVYFNPRKTPSYIIQSHKCS